MAHNDPYKGVELIGRIGQPKLQRHSLQIEIRRPVYMDEDTRSRTPASYRCSSTWTGCWRWWPSRRARTPA